MRSKFPFVDRRHLGKTARAGHVSPEFYRSCYQRHLEREGLDPQEHFRELGFQHGFLPHESFDQCVYLSNPQSKPILFNQDGSFTYDGSLNVELSSLSSRISQINFSEYHGSELSEDFFDSEKEQNLFAASNYRYGYNKYLEYHGFKLNYYAPDFDKFLGEIENLEPTSYVKIPHGFWDAIIFVETLARQLRVENQFSKLNDDMCFALARRMIQSQRPHNGGFAETFFEDVIHVFKQAIHQDSIYLALSFKGYPTWDNRLYHVSNRDDAVKVRIAKLKEHLPTGFSFCDGTLLKRWTISGVMPKLMAALRKRPVMLVGPQKIKQLISRFDFQRAVFYEIPAYKSQWMRYNLLADLSQQLEFLLANAKQPGVVLIQAGGSLSFWLLLKLRKRFPECTFIDLGQSINPYVAGGPDLPWTKIYETVLFP